MRMAYFKEKIIPPNIYNVYDEYRSITQLFDLMLTGFKQQMLRTCFWDDMLHMTIRSLDQMANMVEIGSEAYKRTQDVKASFILLANQFNPHDYTIMKRLISKFYQDIDTQFELKLWDQTQGLNGVMHHHTYCDQNIVSKPMINKPGTVKFFVPGGKVGQIQKKKIIPMTTYELDLNEQLPNQKF